MREVIKQHVRVGLKCINFKQYLEAFVAIRYFCSYEILLLIMFLWQLDKLAICAFSYIFYNNRNDEIQLYLREGSRMCKIYLYLKDTYLH